MLPIGTSNTTIFLSLSKGNTDNTVKFYVVGFDKIYDLKYE